MNDSTDWGTRATSCELLSFSLRYPTEDLAEAVFSGQWASAAKEVMSAEGAALPDDFGETVAAGANDAQECFRSLRAEATRLFVATPEMVVAPYEGVWRAFDDGVQPLVFVNPHSMEVERFCASCGLGRPNGTNEPLDHISTEFEVLQFLSMVAAGMSCFDEGVPAVESLPGGSAEKAYETFLLEHVRTWFGWFATALSREASHPFYLAVAALLECWIEVSAVDSRLPNGRESK